MMRMYLRVSAQVQVCTKVRDIRLPGTGVASSCEPPGVDVGNQTQILLSAEASLATFENSLPLCLFVFLLFRICFSSVFQVICEITETVMSIIANTPLLIYLRSFLRHF